MYRIRVERENDAQDATGYPRFTEVYNQVVESLDLRRLIEVVLDSEFPRPAQADFEELKRRVRTDVYQHGQSLGPS